LELEAENKFLKEECTLKVENEKQLKDRLADLKDKLESVSAEKEKLVYQVKMLKRST
jgi:hypothetical protein